MPRRTPIERAIAATSDRRLRFDDRMRAEGHRKLTLWCPEGEADMIRELARALVYATPEQRQLLADQLQPALKSVATILGKPDA